MPHAVERWREDDLWYNTLSYPVLKLYLFWLFRHAHFKTEEKTLQQELLHLTARAGGESSPFTARAVASSRTLQEFIGRGV